MSDSNKMLFESGNIVKGCAIFLGQRLDLRLLRKVKPLALSPYTLRAGKQGVVVLFRYGVAVFFGLETVESDSYLEEIQHLIVDPFEIPESDRFEIFSDPNLSEGLINDRICLHAYTLQSLQIVADVLAKSIVLAHYEIALTRQFDRIEPFAESLRKGRHLGPKGRELLSHIGDTLMIEAKMTGRIEVTEKPELVWDYPAYERLYLRLEDEFELTERYDAIDRKLNLISKTAQTTLDIMNAERTLRVEWYIVILIIAEIVIAIMDKIN